MHTSVCVCVCVCVCVGVHRKGLNGCHQFGHLQVTCSAWLIAHTIHSARSKTYKHIYTMLQPFKDKLLPAQLTTDHTSCVAALCVGDLLGHCTGYLVFTQGV